VGGSLGLLQLFCDVCVFARPPRVKTQFYPLLTEADELLAGTHSRSGVLTGV
jgi:hypothetical protein